jgi:hypothetical protein
MDGWHSGTGIVPGIFPAYRVYRVRAERDYFRSHPDTFPDSIKQPGAIGYVGGNGKIDDRYPGILAYREFQLFSARKIIKNITELTFCNGTGLPFHRVGNRELHISREKNLRLPDGITGRLYNVAIDCLIDSIGIHSGSDYRLHGSQAVIPQFTYRFSSAPVKKICDLFFSSQSFLPLAMHPVVSAYLTGMRLNGYIFSK